MNSVSLSRFKTQEASSFALKDRKRHFCNSLNVRNVDFEFFNLKRCDTNFRTHDTLIGDAFSKAR